MLICADTHHIRSSLHEVPKHHRSGRSRLHNISCNDGSSSNYYVLLSVRTRHTYAHHLSSKLGTALLRLHLKPVDSAGKGAKNRDNLQCRSEQTSRRRDLHSTRTPCRSKLRRAQASPLFQHGIANTTRLGYVHSAYTCVLLMTCAWTDTRHKCVHEGRVGTRRQPTPWYHGKACTLACADSIFAS